MKSNLKYNLLGIIILILFWIFFSYIVKVEKLILPTIKDVFFAFKTIFSTEEGWKNLFATLLRIIFVNFLVILISIPTGLILGRKKKVYWTFQWLIDFFRSLPAVALIPLFLFLDSNNSILAISIFSSSLILVTYTINGIHNSDIKRELIAIKDGANNRQIILNIIIPESLSVIFSGIKVSTSVSLILIIVTEIIIGTNSNGIGSAISNLGHTYKIPEMWVYIIISGIIGITLNFLIQNSEKYFKNIISKTK